MAIGAATLVTKSTVVQLRSLYKVATAKRRDDNLSLAMYHAWYYEPLFCPRWPGMRTVELFAKSAIDKAITSLIATPDESTPSSELRAVYDLARQGDQLVWTLTAMTAALNACLDPEKVASVVETVFSVRENPACIVHKNTKGGFPQAITEFLRRGKGAHPQLQKPRYSSNTLLGKRLMEDLALWSRLADVSGLQNHASRLLSPFASESCQWPTTQSPEADLACTLLALLQQRWPWRVKIFTARTPFLSKNGVLLRNGYLCVDASATPLVAFLEALKSAGVEMHIDEVSQDEEQGWPLYLQFDFSLHRKFRLQYDPCSPELHIGYLEFGSWWLQNEAPPVPHMAIDDSC
jgi:hypothetical protein